MKFNRIKEVLDERGIRQTWLATKLNKSYRTIMSYTTNAKQPSFATLYEISTLLNINIKDLLLDEPVPFEKVYKVSEKSSTTQTAKSIEV